MSWLSSLFGGGGEDPLAVQQRAEGAARLAAQQQAQMQIDYLNQLRADQAAKDAALEAKDPTATRDAALASLRGVFTPEFESRYVPETITDPFEQEVYGKQYADAQDVIDRMFKRGVLGGTGKEAAIAKLNEQAPRVRNQLNDIAATILGGERGKLTDIYGRGQERASTLNVGEAFDPSQYTGALNTELASFQSQLPDLFKGNVPSDLFDTSGLAAVGGAAQGAGTEPLNQQGYVPTTEEDKTDPFSGQKPVQKRTTSVF